MSSSNNEKPKPPPPPPKTKTLKERMAELEKNSQGKKIVKTDASHELKNIEGYNFEQRREMIRSRLEFLGGPWKKFGRPREPMPKKSLAIWPALAAYQVRLGSHSLLSDENGRVDISSIPDGKYSVQVFASGISPALPLKIEDAENSSVEIKNGELKNTKVIKLADAAPLLMAISESDFLVGTGRQVHGNLKTADGRSYQVSTETDEDGVAALVLPDGSTLSQVTVQAENSEQIKRDEPIIIRRQVLGEGEADAEVLPNLIAILANATTCGEALAWMCAQSSVKAIVLGDVSYSMEKGHRMDILRRSFLDFLDHGIVQRGASAALASFDDGPLDWCSEEWINSADMAYAASVWIGKLTARSGTNVRRAVEEALHKFPDATDVFVLGDGETEPFCIDTGVTLTKPDDNPEFYPDTNFAAFRASRFPQIRFHFVAFGKDADRQKMQQMTAAGGGAHTDVHFDDE
mmetsp:Transcript_12659/g.17019  ORF Transcript_12659/g.17019 Transcript_12659/m.17019 type:complete len:462 (+) Transcript_12659:70-1455(+)|eukprot:CAMPEP_0197288486 /NCGR_PEP_ID=MMETSP0890-20130614/5573_1 /TAXON_ID=44058 ORGANISM="Aureoumbra lagunensis, Strain CCMP1510" /NCGR_SAMPLE_ID=MMETSP0890 /ASSEMBLY_ACC=CAM_ASM_000533 /LENGTH=461 /DNA_ID=CAMNT_0042759239 /DNA_START=29 /DNA_END=1414 /DNA_ORIENTATION=+